MGRLGLSTCMFVGLCQAVLCLALFQLPFPSLPEGCPSLLANLPTFFLQPQLGYQFLGSRKLPSCLQSVLFCCFISRSTLPIFQPAERIPAAVLALSENHCLAAWLASSCSIQGSNLGLHLLALALLKPEHNDEHFCTKLSSILLDSSQIQLWILEAMIIPRGRVSVLTALRYSHLGLLLPCLRHLPSSLPHLGALVHLATCLPNLPSYKKPSYLSPLSLHLLLASFYNYQSS